MVIIIKPCSIVIQSGSGEKVYDGTALTDGSIFIGGSGFVDGEEFSYTFTGSQTNAGSSENTFDAAAQEGTLADNYDITKENGTLTVTRRPVTLASASAEKEYDGTPLTADGITVSGDGFVDGEGAEYSITCSQTEAGSSDNTFSYVLADGTLADNYEITTKFGTLTVKAKAATPDKPEMPDEPVTPDKPAPRISPLPRIHRMNP